MNIVAVETLNGTEFLNLDTVHRFIPGTDGALELRFGQAETLVLTGDSARLVMAWVTAQAQAFQPAVVSAPTRQTTVKSPTATPSPRRVQLMTWPSTQATVALPATPTPSDVTAITALPGRQTGPSPTIDRQQWQRRTGKICNGSQKL